MEAFSATVGKLYNSSRLSCLLPLTAGGMLDLGRVILGGGGGLEDIGGGGTAGLVPDFGLVIGFALVSTFGGIAGIDLGVGLRLAFVTGVGFGLIALAISGLLLVSDTLLGTCGAAAL
jgi:hypothetical protein